MAKKDSNSNKAGALQRKRQGVPAITSFFQKRKDPSATVTPSTATSADESVVDLTTSISTTTSSHSTSDRSTTGTLTNLPQKPPSDNSTKLSTQACAHVEPVAKKLRLEAAPDADSPGEACKRPLSNSNDPGVDHKEDANQATSQTFIAKEDLKPTLDKTNAKAPSKVAHSFFKPRAKQTSVVCSAENALDPKIIVAWNVNGLVNRLKFYDKAIQEFLEREQPDVVFISETKMRASSNQKRNELCSRDKRSIDEATVLRQALASGCLKTHPIMKLSLADRRYAGTAVLLRKNGPRPVRIWYGLPDPETMEKVPHNEEGRIILLEWKSIMTLHTYTPNNGWTIDSFARRREWDATLTSWLRNMARQADRKPVIYMGDLNAAPEDRDVSDPEWFNAQGDPPESGEADDVGQPGCTNNEQKRFKTMLQAGDLIDMYRHLESTLKIQRSTDIEAPIYTWRGHPGVERPEAGRFYKKGMRIDHHLVARKLLPRVKRAEICGQGVSAQDPSFLGSDHCPILLHIDNA